MWKVYSFHSCIHVHIHIAITFIALSTYNSSLPFGNGSSGGQPSGEVARLSTGPTTRTVSDFPSYFSSYFVRMTKRN